MSTTIQSGKSFQLYDLHNSPDILDRQVTGRMWGHLKNHGRSFASLRMLQGRSNVYSVSASEMFWGVGDAFSESEVLGATLAYNATQITLTNAYHQPQDMFYVYLATGGSGSTPAKALVRLGSLVSGSVYNCTILEYSGTTPSFTTSSTVFKLAPAVKYADQAREYLNMKGDIAKNVFQRARTTYGKSKREQSEPSIIENSLNDLVNKGMEHEVRKLNKSLFMNGSAIGGGSTTQSGYDYGVMGTFDYHFNPETVSFAESAGKRNLYANGAYYGINKVIETSGGVLTYDGLIDWLIPLSEYGPRDRMVFASPAMYRKVQKALENRVAIVRQDYAQVAPTYADVWNLPVAELGFMNLWFVVDHGMTGISKIVKGNIPGDSVYTANPLDWMVAFSPEHTHLTPQVEKGVTKDMRIVNVETTNNDDVEKLEIEYSYSFSIDDARTGGFFGIKTA